MRPVGHGIPTLTAQPASIRFDYVGDQVPLLITAKFPDGPPVIATKSPNTSYLSGDTSVASVNSQGIVTAAGPGSTYILVSGVLEVPVYVPAPVVVMPPMASLYPGGAQQFTATLNIAASMGTVKWSATPPGVGTISSSGLYTAPNQITAQQVVTVTATYAADPTQSGSATLSPSSTWAPRATSFYCGGFNA
jgi:hypothetical protein